jgi:peptidoglycan/LPS O-acetylase OafA/YrhL
VLDFATMQVVTRAQPSRNAVLPDQRILPLDGLRAIASLMVVAYHFGPHIARARNGFWFLHSLPNILWEGVDLFFVLSGFLISGILLASRDSPRYFKTFYIRRAFRIFPLYYLVVFSYLAATAMSGPQHPRMPELFENPLPVTSFLFYVQNFAMTAAGNFGPVWLAGTWSLAVEEQFYLTLPLLIRKLQARGVFWMVLAALICAPLFRGILQKLHVSMGGYVLLPARLDSLAAGVMIALLLTYRRDLIAGRERWIRCGAVILIVARVGYQYVPNPQAIRMAFLSHTANLAVFSGILLSVLVSPGMRFTKFLAFPLMRELGNMAYSTYLFHPIFLRLVFGVLRGTDPRLQSSADLGPLLLALLITLSASWISWRFFERSLIAVGHRWKY